jgi:hypothetical protein
MERILKGASLTVLVTVLAGCASSSNVYSQYLLVLKQSFSDTGITLQQAAAVPYASLGYRVDGSRERLIVLASNTGGTLLWTSADHIVLVTRDGRLLRTVGLTHDIAGLAGAEPLPGAAIAGAFSSKRLADFPDLNRYSVPINCTVTAKGSEAITILGRRISTVRVEENCRSDAMDWSFANEFWVSPDGKQTWRSVQYIHPQGTVVQTQLLRPPE